jgi:hypothetical protein
LIINVESLLVFLIVLNLNEFHHINSADQKKVESFGERNNAFSYMFGEETCRRNKLKEVVVNVDTF